jgi:hypothetical protein
MKNIYILFSISILLMGFGLLMVPGKALATIVVQIFVQLLYYMVIWIRFLVFIQHLLIHATSMEVNMEVRVVTLVLQMFITTTGTNLTILLSVVTILPELVTDTDVKLGIGK